MPKKVFLRPSDLARHSKHHTAYAGDGPVTVDGKPGPLYRLEFHGGVAENVDEATFQRFKDLGIADLKRPSRGDDDA